MAGFNLPESARQEAWEEAGIKGEIRPAPVGTYLHSQVRADNFVQPLEIHVFQIDHPVLADDYPEAGQRERRWWPLAEAAAIVEQPGLATLLRKLAQP